jgi:hypothetical protein
MRTTITYVVVAILIGLAIWFAVGRRFIKVTEAALLRRL